MRSITITILAACLLAAGACTAPMQPIAAQSLTRFDTTNQQHIDDLARLAKQQVVNAAVGIAATQPVSKAIEFTANECEKVSWIQVQAERNRSRFMLGYQFVEAQQGILNLWWRDLKNAWAKNAEVPASQ